MYIKVVKINIYFNKKKNKSSRKHTTRMTMFMDLGIFMQFNIEYRVICGWEYNNMNVIYIIYRIDTYSNG